MRRSPDRAVLVRVLAGNIVLCSWARHFTLIVPLSSLSTLVRMQTLHGNLRVAVPLATRRLRLISNNPPLTLPLHQTPTLGYQKYITNPGAQ